MKQQNIRRFAVVLMVVLLAPIGRSGHAEDLSLKMKQLEEEMAAMKEAVLKEKVQVRELEEAVLFGKITATYGYITFRNEAGSVFEMSSGEFFLNNKLVYKLTPEQMKKASGEAVSILDGEMPPGENTVTLQLKFRGQKKGPFTYMEDYELSIDSKKVFNVEQGKTRALEIVVFDRGNVRTDVKDRLAVTFNLTTGS